MQYVDIDITDKKQIKKGMYVEIIYRDENHREKQYCGYIQKVLTQTSNGKSLKVELTNGIQGRLLGIPSKIDIEKETFKYYNLFLNQFHICALFERKTNSCHLLNVKGKSCILLFSDSKNAKELIKNTKFDCKEFYIKPISRVKYITETYMSDYYVIDIKRKIKQEQLNNFEKKFY